ncbi:tyrosine-type recombinase/integrase [Candidatus Thiodiazotropha endoloripes]|uniref:tyrosine-type recombinase/integrase n=1 Tax=Candidatus Thiodiazotropha endoloripes TaxID=1818881 RepID=UPI00083D8EAC|nr:tyrosine-type recombinase/integrase [Candidatus Thiodiazotropha endoloripes]MCG7872389.1 tyrosine-type recombinase/integrase [Candidatus Thiodiazotropha lotti]
MSDMKYMVKRGHTFYYKRKYPVFMQEVYGTFFTKSLKTRDINEARRLRDMMHTEFHREVEEAQDEGRDVPLVIRMAKQLHKLKGSAEDTPEGNAEAGLLDALEMYVNKHEQTEAENIRQALMIAKAKKDSPSLRSLLAEYESWCADGLTNGAVRDRMKMIDIWADEIGRDVPIHSCLNQDEAWEFVQKHIINSGVTQKTKQRRLNTLKLFFDWVMSKRIVTMNPFETIKLEVIKGRRAEAKPEGADRKAWTDSQLQSILAEFKRMSQEEKLRITRENASRCHSLTLIAIHTGMRRDEICSLQVEDCARGVFRVREGKTSSAVREVPIHSAIRPLVGQLVGDRSTGPLIKGLVPGGPDNRPSWNIGKVFGRVKKSLGFSGDYVFHGLRHTFITKMEQSDVNLLLIERVVGHKSNALAFNTYSKGQTLEAMSEAVEKITYDLQGTAILSPDSSY